MFTHTKYLSLALAAALICSSVATPVLAKKQESSAWQTTKNVIKYGAIAAGMALSIQQVYSLSKSNLHDNVTEHITWIITKQYPCVLRSIFYTGAALTIYDSMSDDQNTN